MSEKLRESLSAVMDGEADEFELRRVLDEVGRDERLRDEWIRYHEVRAVLRGEYQAVGAGLRARVWEAVTGEDSAGREPPIPVAEPEHRVSPRTGRFVGIAVAAVVALGVAVGVSVYERGPDTPPLASAVEAIDGRIQGPVVQMGAMVTPVDLRRARAYMMHHVQHKAMNQPGVSSFAKMVAFEPSTDQE